MLHYINVGARRLRRALDERLNVEGVLLFMFLLFVCVS